MHCIIGALSLNKNEDIKINDLLDDYIFFNYIKINVSLSMVTNLSDFKDIINKHYEIK